MSSDLLAEFDSFYRKPQDAIQPTAPASNDLALLSASNAFGSGQSAQNGGFQPWQNSFQSSAKPIENSWASMSSSSFQASSQGHATASQQDDIWGSFGAVEPVGSKPPVSITPAYRGSTMGMEQRLKQEKPEIVRRSTLDLFSQNAPISQFTSRGNQEPYVAPQRTSAVKATPFGEVLFDADEIDEDDDFGEFESVTAEPPPIAASNSINDSSVSTFQHPITTKKPANLLSISNPSSSTLPYPQAPKSPSFQERNPFADLGLSTKSVSTVKDNENQNSASPVTAWPSFEPSVPKPIPYEDSPAPDDQFDDSWGDFADLPPETPVIETAGIEADAWGWDSVDKVANVAPMTTSVNTPPPANVPPPSVLLTLFHPIFDLPQDALFKPVSSQSFSLKNRIISDPCTVQFLRAYLLIATVAARIIAGRKHRWRRDALLSQAMKIGPAAAGGKGGMKLTGIDKAETTREDREAAEVVRLWKDQIGKLRSAVAVANSSMSDVSKHLSIPDVSDAMHIKTQPRGLTAPKPCVICGLRREERINKVDVDVEDTFGEWWTEHWGHRACRNFWLEHKAKLHQR